MAYKVFKYRLPVNGTITLKSEYGAYLIKPVGIGLDPVTKLPTVWMLVSTDEGNILNHSFDTVWTGESIRSTVAEDYNPLGTLVLPNDRVVHIFHSISQL